MAFIDEPASIALGFDARGRGSLLLGNGSELNIPVGFQLSGDIFQKPTVVQARALNPTRLRIDFSSGLDNGPAPLALSNYKISPGGFSLVAVNVLSVSIPNLNNPLFVELEVTEMTNGGGYAVAVNPGSPSNPITSGDIPIDNASVPFLGQGSAPYVSLAIATSPTEVEVRFSENVKNSGDILDPGTYSFDNGLEVVEVVSSGSDIATLKTSTQNPDVLYLLTVDGFIQDGANNTLATPATSPMLGFQSEGVTDPTRIQRIYDFLIQTIRDEDQRSGGQLVERYLAGPQAVWEANTEIILSIPKLWDITEVLDEYLIHVKSIVGWTKDLDNITDSLDASSLRRLIANSVAFWNGRGTEPSTRDILTLVTSARVSVLNWFHYRFIVGENSMSAEVDALDLSVIPYLDSGVSGDETVYEVRIVDDGSLDRALVVGLAKLTRPIGERVLVFYLSLLDQFQVDADNSQWDSNLVVSGGMGIVAQPTSGELESVVSLPRAASWSNYTTLFRARQRPSNPTNQSTAHYRIYRTGDADHYGVAVTIGPDGSAGYSLSKSVNGVVTELDGGPIGFQLHHGVYFSVKVSAVRQVSDTSIKVCIDGNEIASATDSDHAQGSISVVATDETEVELEHVEVFLNPLEWTLIDIGDTITNHNF